MKTKLNFLLSGLSLVLMVACASQPNFLPVDKIPASNSEEIQIAKAYDYVFLNTFDALDSLQNWAPDQTRKDEGIIRVHNTQYSRLDDADLRNIIVHIRRDDTLKTSVYLDSDSRRVIGADQVLAVIRKKFSTV